jgi:hypothetical protein
VEFETIAQLIGFAGQRILFQVEYVENGSDTWDWVPHSQHVATLTGPLRIFENRLILANAEREAIAEAKRLNETYEAVHVVKLSAQQVWEPGQEDRE